MGEAVSPGSSLVGRESELDVLDQLLDDVHTRGGCLEVTGGPGVGKSALLAEAAARAAVRGMLVLHVTGVQSEASLAFAGLHHLLRAVLGHLDQVAAPQRNAIEAAFGLSNGPAPDMFLTALAALDLLAEGAARAPVLAVADDAQWLDRPTRDVLAFVARRLEFEPVLLVTAVRDGEEGPPESGRPVLRLEALPPLAAAALLDARAPGLPEGVRARLLDEAAGNPLALVELPTAYGKLGIGTRVPTWLPLTTRLERTFAARAFDLPVDTRAALLVAALDDGPRLSEVLDAAALVTGAAVTVGVLDPAVSACLIEINGAEFRFRHPLMRAAIRQKASISQRQVVHAALADVLADRPDRAAWHRAASIVGPDERVARELEAVANQAQRRGGVAVAVSALQRAAELSDGPHRAGRLLRAAELGFEIGQQDLVLGLLAEAETLGLASREQARLTWIRDSFTDGIPGDATQARSLAEAARQAAAEGDTDLALNLLYGAALRCWWVDPGQATRDEVLAAAERVDVAQTNPQLLVALAFADPIARGAAVIERLSRLPAAVRSDAAAMRLAGNAAMAVGAFDLATRFQAAAATGLRAQGRLGLLPRALAQQAWCAAHLADLGAAIPAADEGRRLAQETRQPLVMATAEATQAMLAAFRGDVETAAAIAAKAEQTAIPIRASGLLAATQLARGLAALGAGRPADALAHLRRIHDPADPAYHYAVRCFTIGDLAEAASRAGDPQGIDGYMQEMEAAARQTPSPSLHAGLRYARALLANGPEAETLFDEAVQSGLNGWPFPRARVQLAYGEWLHRRRQDSAARAPLRAATEAFDALGVIPWSERARQQLRATGETSRSRTPEARDQLSPQELQIAQLAAEGLSNREIGQKLYLSHRTISSHLYRVFPKLGITSRTELRQVLGRTIRTTPRRPRPAAEPPGKPVAARTRRRTAAIGQLRDSPPGQSPDSSEAAASIRSVAMPHVTRRRPRLMHIPGLHRAAA
jgi:DNA-binding CsgD family transcriptional regulator